MKVAVRLGLMGSGLLGVSLLCIGFALAPTASAVGGPNGNRGVASQDLPSEPITVVMTEIEPFVVNNDGEPDGFYAEIWDEVAASMGVNYETVWVDSFGELLPALDDGRADVVVAPLAPTADREANFDFSSTVVPSGPQLAYTDRISGARPSLVAALVDSQVLQLAGLAIGGLIMLSHVMWLLERNRYDEGGDFRPSYLRGVWDGVWWSTVTTTTVGYGDKAPKSFAGKLVAVAAMLSSLIFVAAFVSQVTALLGERRFAAPVQTLDDVRGPIGVLGDSSFAAFLDSEGMEIREYETQLEVFAGASAGEVDVIVANPFALETLASPYGLTPVGGVLYAELETFGLPQGSPLREPINQTLATMHASGEIAEIIKDALN